MNIENRFWMVYNTTTYGPPTVRHLSRHVAAAEAIRLAHANPGHCFVVLSCVDGYYCPKPIPQPPPVLQQIKFV